MKRRRRESHPAAAVASSGAWSAGKLAVWAAAALAAAFAAYGPALDGEFLFDDLSLPFGLPRYTDSLLDWMAGVRPALMLTYWVNWRVSGSATYSYHALSVIFHWMAAALVFLVVRRCVELAGEKGSRRHLLAGIAGAVFLLHPVQTEAVAYLAGRSDCLSGMLVLAALALFLYRPGPAISWPRAAAVAALFLAALASKEQAVALLPLLLLADWWWNPGFSPAGIRANWRLYLPMLGAAAAGVAFFWGLITRASTAGFALKDFTWYQYLFTQFRALFVYLRLFVAPYGQTLDYDFPISRSLLDYGAIFGMAGLLAITAAAWHWRRRYPLGAFGWFVFLVLMAPTSSILPIQDPVAERRLYTGMLGLLLMLVEALRRTRLQPQALAGLLAAVAVAGGALTYSRAGVWASAVALWEDAVVKTPNKMRAHFQLASAYYQANRCDAAVDQFAAAARILKPNYDLLLDWGLALDCLNRPDEAVAKMREAAALDPIAHVYSQIGMVYAKRKRWVEALDALAIAEKIDPAYIATWIYKGGVRLATGDAAQAVRDYRRALQIDPGNQQAQQGLAMAEKALAGGR